MAIKPVVKPKSTLDGLGDSVNLNELINSLELSEEALAHEILEQPKLFLQAARYRVEKMKVRMRAEAVLNQIQLETAGKVRQTEADVKVTEKYIQEQTDQDPSVRAAQRAFDDAKVMEEWSKLLLDSFRERGSSCKVIVQLLGAEAAKESGLFRAELEHLGVNQLKDKVKKRYPGAQE